MCETDFRCTTTLSAQLFFGQICRRLRTTDTPTSAKGVEKYEFGYHIYQYYETSSKNLRSKSQVSTCFGHKQPSFVSKKLNFFNRLMHSQLYFTTKQTEMESCQISKVSRFTIFFLVFYIMQTYFLNFMLIFYR